jgi:probable addiction module antidote protein
MPKRTTDFREDLLADLADPQEAAQYLNAAFEDSEQMALVALRDVAEARQMIRVAEEAGVAREALYRMLHPTGNPTYSNLTGILNALGLKIVFAPAGPANEPAEKPKSPTLASTRSKRLRSRRRE